jgi:hypothetical protein
LADEFLRTRPAERRRGQSGRRAVDPRCATRGRSGSAAIARGLNSRLIRNRVVGRLSASLSRSVTGPGPVGSGPEGSSPVRSGSGGRPSSGSLRTRGVASGRSRGVIMVLTPLCCPFRDRCALDPPVRRADGNMVLGTDVAVLPACPPDGYPRPRPEAHSPELFRSPPGPEHSGYRSTRPAPASTEIRRRGRHQSASGS